MSGTSVLGKFVKQPTEVLDYFVDYSEWFSTRDDTPSSVATTAETGITHVSSTIIGETVRVVLSGGTDGQQYKITVRLTTAGGLVKEADFLVRVKEV